jgi:myo-inositol-1(or 4)-monophosphatase
MPDQLDVCEAAARAGGRVLADWRGRFGVSKKGQRDYVTEADFAAQREIRRIRR